jgi:3-oxoacyl-[acyl-carrier protein] reductase
MRKKVISGPIDLHGRNALVTGGAKGIGEATALALAREGANVAVADIISTQKTVDKIQSLGRDAVGINANVAAPSDVKHMVTEAVARFGHIDILINNAGIVHRDTLLETSEATWNRVMDVVLKGTFLCIQAIYPHMKSRKYGKIVNVSSISGITGGAFSNPKDMPEQISSRSGPAYAAGSGGVIALTKWIAKEVGKDGLYVNTVASGACHTEMTQGYDYRVQGLPIARMGEPEDIAEAILFFASDASNYITGQVLNVDGGWIMI